jgi:hypothetical protein
MSALRVEQMSLPPEIAQALDDVSSITVGYPERES